MEFRFDNDNTTNAADILRHGGFMAAWGAFGPILGGSSTRSRQIAIRSSTLTMGVVIIVISLVLIPVFPNFGVVIIVISTMISAMKMNVGKLVVLVYCTY